MIWDERNLNYWDQMAQIKADFNLRLMGVLHQLYSLADLFNRTSYYHLPWEASTHAAVNTQKLFVNIYPPLSIAIHTAE